MVRIDLRSVADFELTGGCRQPQRSGGGERRLDELATTLAGVKIHGWEAVLRLSRALNRTDVSAGSTRIFNERVCHYAIILVPSVRLQNEPFVSKSDWRSRVARSSAIIALDHGS